MGKHLRKLFSVDQVKEVFQRYLSRQIAVDQASKVSWNTLKFSVSGVPIREEVELRISFNLKTRLALIRFWYQEKLVGEQQVKAEDLKKVHF